MSKYEQYIIEILRSSNTYFEREKSYTDLREGAFRFDFYLPYIQSGALIEIDGEQHFYSNPKFFHSRAEFMKQQNNDRRKNSYCLAHNIPLYRIPYWEINNIHSINDIIQEKYLVKSKWHNDDLWQKYQKTRV